ncbi:hypothetical protein NT2_07_01550 [Caenibius tardaugens NBRC 16725]|uniref:Diguanylate cyclase n=1 Tax=Caenibius tardaugens NBRC 16725 TaxID=1219035 RepID=U2YMY9_9SPHN|nr:diguanylate cyclase [Caenibius tardaugens]AZI35562.1 diguanylate cyclase [Caenibius tardaugens NBRC 16725]TXH01460.1 MAG: diguanylate cyclase [Rhodocyclaceae bacterium]GAD50155.1 hypothetical protein NT2_07_01550 [Caenibius tardaugens NBRC 16725]
MVRRSSQPLPGIRDVLDRYNRRLMLLTLFLLCAALIGTGVHTIRYYFQSNLSLVARSISYTVEPAVVFEDMEAARDGIASVASMQGVRFVELRAPDGRLLANWFHSPSDTNTETTRVEQLFRIAHAVSPIRRDGQLIGTVHVAGDTSVLTNFLLYGGLSLLCCVVGALLAMRILTRQLVNGVIKPLQDIASVAHAVRQDRALERRVAPSGIAELDRFGHDFNALLNELEGWHVSLQDEKDKLQHDALHDPLTGLGNRAFFDHVINGMITDAPGKEAAFALLYLDLDHFKSINDQYGHIVGDAMLMAVGERLRKAIRPSDHAFRIGGDEFAVIVSALPDDDTLRAVASRIDESLSHAFDVNDTHTIAPSISIGHALYPRDAQSSPDLIRQADERMYQHKLKRRRFSSVQETYG